MTDDIDLFTQPLTPESRTSFQRLDDIERKLEDLSKRVDECIEYIERNRNRVPFEVMKHVVHRILTGRRNS